VRILLVGPDHPHGSLPPYLNVLADNLRILGAHVDRLGSTGVPYDPHTGRFHDAEQITAAADLATRGDPGRYDAISLHFGNLEVEQLLPARWRAQSTDLPPVVVHVHALEPTLFTVHVPDPLLRAAAEQAITDAAGLIYFGRYAHTTITRRLPATVHIPCLVAPLPTTIGTGTTPATTPRLAVALHAPRPDAVVLSLCGYAAPWKGPLDLLAALERTITPVRVVLALSMAPSPILTVFRVWKRPARWWLGGALVSPGAAGTTPRGPDSRRCAAVWRCCPCRRRSRPDPGQAPFLRVARTAVSGSRRRG
jgi:hypothetical protein